MAGPSPTDEEKLRWGIPVNPSETASITPEELSDLIKKVHLGKQAENDIAKKAEGNG